MIPKTLHLIWVGDEARKPVPCIQSWIDGNPGWTVKIWGNAEFRERAWINRAHMLEMARREWNGVADMMRWEILFDEGGVLVDADSWCTRPLPDWLLDCEAFACWENELIRPGLIAAGYFGTVPRNPFLARLIEGIRTQATVVDRMAWASVGPLHLTETWKGANYANLTILPSHFFIPRHFTGVEYTGSGPVFARQEWGSTLNRYDELVAAPSLPGQAFLFEPDWSGAEWVEVLLSYLHAFTPEDPVSLVFLVAQPGKGGIGIAEAEGAVRDILRRTGRSQIPGIVLVQEPEDLLAALRQFPAATWVPRGSGATEGFRGLLGARFMEARRSLTAG